MNGTKLAGACVLLLASCFACSRRSGDLLTPVRGPREKRPFPGVPARVRAVETVPPAEMRDALRRETLVNLDRRFLPALASLASLGGGAAPAISASWSGESWVVSSGGRTLGTLSETPSPLECLDLLRPEAGKLVAGWLRETRAPSARELRVFETSLDAVFGGEPRRALEQMDALWKSGTRSPELLTLAARALIVLDLQTLDEYGTRDPLESAALAVLAAAEAATGRRLPAEEALLAATMGYGGAARTPAGTLPARDPVRLYVERKDAALAALASRRGSPARTKYLHLMRLASGPRREFDEQARRVVGDERAELPLLVPVFRARHDTWHPEVGSLVAEATLREAASGAAKDVPLLRVADVIASEGRTSPPREPLDAVAAAKRLEEALTARSAKAGPLFSAEAQGAFFRSPLLSAITSRSLRVLVELASAPAAVEVAGSLGTLPPGPWKSFQIWFDHLARFHAGEPTLTLLEKDASELEDLGRTALLRTLQVFDERLPANQPERPRAMKIMLARLDTRPESLGWLVRMLERDFLDPVRAARLSRAFVQQTGVDEGLRSALFALKEGRTEEVLRALRDPSAEPGARFWLVYRLALEKTLAGPSLRDELIRIGEADTGDRGFDGLSPAVRLMIFHGWAADAERLVRNVVARTPKETDSLKLTVLYRCLSDTLFAQSRYAEAWAAIEPWLATGKGDALGAGALALDGLGKHAEALEMARADRDRYPHSIWDRLPLARVLWRRLDYGGAAQVFADPKHPVAVEAWRDQISRAFLEEFRTKGPEVTEQAFRPFVNPAVNVWFQFQFARRFAEEERWEEAVRILERVLEVRGAYGHIDPELLLVRCVRRWKGEEAARELIHKNVDAGLALDFAGAAFDFRDFESLREIDPSSVPEGSREELWLLRAEALLLDRESESAFGKAVRDHFAVAPDSNPDAVLARYLLGLESDEALFGSATDPKRRSRAAWAKALRELHDGHAEAGADWLRVVLELGQVSDRSYRRANQTATHWLDANRTPEVLHREGRL